MTLTTPIIEPIAIVGTTGSGKTYAAKGIVEDLLARGRRVCIIDPLGVWYGLRTTADGEAPAFPVTIFGGDRADFPITTEDGAALGAVIADGLVQASIVDTSDLTGGETIKLMTPFFETLFAKNREALLLVIDEADAFAPQNPVPGAERLKGAVDKIARRGRVKGFRLMTITQRPAVLDKSVLSQIATLIAMGLRSPQDRKAIEGWVKGNADENMAKDVLASLPKLARGEGWIWSPGADILKRKTFPLIRTLDTSKTPEPGKKLVEARAVARVDVAAIRAALGAVGAKAIEPTKATAADLAAAEQRGYQRGLAEGEKRGVVQGQALALTRMRSALDALRIQEIPAGSLVADDGRKDAGPEGNHRPTSGAGPKPSAVASADGALNSAARKMLAVLDTNPPVRRSWQQVATLAGLKARGGHFNAGRKAIIDGGYIIERDGLIEHANPSPGAAESVSDPAAIVDMWAASLSGAAPKILRFLFGESRDGLGGRQGTKEWIAEQLGMQPRGGHWNAAWKELRDNGIVTINGNIARLTDLFAPAELNRNREASNA
ncbi:hypothetical protein C3941_19525 [Kaistia algarum]|uniref:ATP-binding protein n=1 Tax=Kaistia algarum TaxID=2083279 RepID=UPI000CE79E08|nr:type IV secretory system conjugative DNA transfer family protein [Kaistia algarum]MCX5516183.1 DUF87 domain-containing protein [Kaistia algarum]PPE78257.1 hypothetical protein C3941_19525 [Kaistia algarum]